MYSNHRKTFKIGDVQMKRLSSTDEKTLQTIEKLEALVTNFNELANTDLKNFTNNLNQFRQTLLMLKEINSLSSSIALNKSDFEDTADNIADALEDLSNEYKNLKQSMVIIKEKISLVEV